MNISGPRLLGAFGGLVIAVIGYRRARVGGGEDDPAGAVAARRCACVRDLFGFLRLLPATDSELWTWAGVSSYGMFVGIVAVLAIALIDNGYVRRIVWVTALALVQLPFTLARIAIGADRRRGPVDAWDSRRAPLDGAGRGRRRDRAVPVLPSHRGAQRVQRRCDGRGHGSDLGGREDRQPTSSTWSASRAARSCGPRRTLPRTGSRFWSTRGCCRADEEAQAVGDAVEVIDVSAHEPRRIPFKKWRELIKKVWEADPLRCPKRSREMRIVSLIDEADVIERVLRHLGLWQEGCACIAAPTRRAKRPSIRGSTTPSPTTTPNRSCRSPPAETSGSTFARTPRMPSQIELVDSNRVNLAVTDAPVILFQPSLHHRFDRVPTQEKPVSNISQGHEPGQVHDQSRERTRDFRVGLRTKGSPARIPHPSSC